MAVVCSTVLRGTARAHKTGGQDCVVPTSRVAHG